MRANLEVRDDFCPPLHLIPPARPCAASITLCPFYSQGNLGLERLRDASTVKPLVKRQSWYLNSALLASRDLRRRYDTLLPSLRSPPTDPPRRLLPPPPMGTGLSRLASIHLNDIILVTMFLLCIHHRCR